MRRAVRGGKFRRAPGAQPMKTQKRTQAFLHSHAAFHFLHMPARVRVHGTRLFMRVRPSENSSRQILFVVLGGTDAQADIGCVVFIIIHKGIVHLAADILNAFNIGNIFTGVFNVTGIIDFFRILERYKFGTDRSGCRIDNDFVCFGILGPIRNTGFSRTLAGLYFCGGFIGLPAGGTENRIAVQIVIFGPAMKALAFGSAVGTGHWHILFVANWKTAHFLARFVRLINMVRPVKRKITLVSGSWENLAHPGKGQGQMIIAIDGPAASGKGTIASALATHYGLAHLDTGLLYRAVGKAVLDRLEADNLEYSASEAAKHLDESQLDAEVLGSAEIAMAASKVARFEPVRAALRQYQREFARQPGGAVLDGRDIGTRICPDANVKLFITAEPEVRAARRTAQFRARGIEAEYENILAQIIARDKNDRQNPAGAFYLAEGAHLLDTSQLDIEAALRAAIAIVDGTVERKLNPGETRK